MKNNRGRFRIEYTDKMRLVVCGVITVMILWRIMYPMILENAAPVTFIGYKALSEMRSAMIKTIAINISAYVMKILLIALPIGLFLHDIYTGIVYREEKSSAVIFGRLVNIYCLFAVLIAVFGGGSSNYTLMSRSADECTLSNKIQMISALKNDIQSAETNTERFRYFKIFFDHDKSYTQEFCYLNCSGTSFSISESDLREIRKEMDIARIKDCPDASYTAVGYEIGITYFGNSRLIKDYSVSAYIMPGMEVHTPPPSLNVATKEELNADYPTVEITLDEKSMMLRRPADMEDYGDIAWVIKRDGKIIPYFYNEPFTTRANNSEKLSLKTAGSSYHQVNYMEVGDYEVTLVKLFIVYDYDTGTWDYQTKIISNTVTYTIDDKKEDIEGEEIPVTTEPEPEPEPLEEEHRRPTNKESFTEAYYELGDKDLRELIAYFESGDRHGIIEMFSEETQLDDESYSSLDNMLDAFKGNVLEYETKVTYVGDYGGFYAEVKTDAGKFYDITLFSWYEDDIPERYGLFEIVFRDYSEKDLTEEEIPFGYREFRAGESLVKYIR